MTLVTGDPAGMRAAAAQLRLRAETLSSNAANVDADVAGLTYVGEAADRFRGSISECGTNLRSLSDRMINTADTLQRQAAVVEEQQLAERMQTELWVR